MSTDKARAKYVVKAIETANQSISSVETRALKYCKIATAPLAFYRGTNHLFWADFATDKRLARFGSQNTVTWLQGDLHPYNFGSFDNNTGEVVYDLNDFDETIIADYQYDLWRMAIGIVVMARQYETLGQQKLESVIDTFSETYLDTLTAYRGKNKKDLPYFTKHNAFGKLDDFLKQVETEYSRQGMLDKWAPLTEAGRRLNPNREKLGQVKPAERAAIIEAMADYQTTLSNKPAASDTYFQVKDVARRLLAGTGSLGTPRYYVLIEGGDPGNEDDDRILDIKLQGKPTPYHYLSEQERQQFDRQFEHNAQRHMAGYQALTARTDAHLGWLRLKNDYYSVRERSPYKEAFPGEKLDTKKSFAKLAEQWAAILAANHARANLNLGHSLPKQVDEVTKGQRKKFRTQVREVAFEYAQQVEADWQAFKNSSRPTYKRGLIPD